MATDRDPVTGVEIDRLTAIRLDHGDHVHYFVSEETRAAFLADPARYHDAHAGRESRAAGDTRDSQSRGADDAGPGALARPDDPPFTVDKHGMTAPKFGAAGSGGLEYEPLPPGVRD